MIFYHKAGNPWQNTTNLHTAFLNSEFVGHYFKGWFHLTIHISRCLSTCCPPLSHFPTSLLFHLILPSSAGKRIAHAWATLITIRRLLISLSFASWQMGKLDRQRLKKKQKKKLMPKNWGVLRSRWQLPYNTAAWFLFFFFHAPLRCSNEIFLACREQLRISYERRELGAILYNSKRMDTLLPLWHHLAFHTFFFSL